MKMKRSNDFDDPNQVRIQMEALACQEIFIRAERGDVHLVWSFMHEDENYLCPFHERKMEVFRLSNICKVRLGPEKDIYDIDVMNPVDYIRER